MSKQPTIKTKQRKSKMDKSFRLFDFNVYSAEKTQEESSDDEQQNHVNEDRSFDDEYGESYGYTEPKKKSTTYKDSKIFMIQMFGVNEKGETCSIIAEHFKPFFYVKVDDDWTQGKKLSFLAHIKQQIGKYYEDSISECKLIKRKKLYGFDGGKLHKFVMFKFENERAFNKVKNLWFEDKYNHKEKRKQRRLIPKGYLFDDCFTQLYEANIPPLLRYFHIKQISPSGWVALPTKKLRKPDVKRTSCKYEWVMNYKDIIPLNDKETPVPLKICSFDIEASSSHGDFPIPVKTYKKLAGNIMELWESDGLNELDREDAISHLENMIHAAFGYADNINIDLVYPKHHPDKEFVNKLFTQWIATPVKELADISDSSINTIENMFEERYAQINQGGGDEGANGCGEAYQEGGENAQHYTRFNKPTIKSYTKRKATIIDMLNDKTFDRESKVNELTNTLTAKFPKLEGDKVTFIGSTFMRYGEKEPYFNHCIALDTCDELHDVENSQIETYQTEHEVLLAWTKLIQKVDPDIIIGYNIFGFDYQFMFQRAKETRCAEAFLKLSRNKDELCGQKDFNTGELKIEESSIVIASGQHDLHFIKMNGRLQVDLYNYFRRDYNLTSYKLDYVSGYFIGDTVKKFEHISAPSVRETRAKSSKPGTPGKRLRIKTKPIDKTRIYSKNLLGLKNHSYIVFEESSHSTDMYKDGAKFKVENVNEEEGTFEIIGHESPDMSKHVKWCLAKDDVTPQDIFRMTNEGPKSRAVIAKYCIQDCNLVHYLMNKIDVITGFIEMAKICSVPMNFLVMRGQGIKLTSYISKKCREKDTLMPVIEKKENDDGYEGAIVLPPKCNLYLDNPVACVDYSSLYPSCMISENLSHDSKVWTKEYDLEGNLIKETGEKTASGEFKYDNLEDYEYVDVTHDTYSWIPNERGKRVKTKKGTKTCRFAQFKEGNAIMPSILKELLAARKATRKQIPNQKDEFMKNVLDKRQLSYKITANSLYGQCGARTSTFYEKDVAASTTATGRKLLTYAQRLIEEVYGDCICETKKYGKVHSKAEYIYGDTDSVFFTFNLEELDGTPIRGKKALEITIELAQEAGELATKFLKGPHDLEYEKTFMPFCLLSKKRYVGMLYELDPEKCKRKSMGIVLKRRDNAPIVKDIYGGIIDILMKEQNIEEAIMFLKSSLQKVVDGEYGMDKLIITKSLRSNYKNPQQIAHKVLADRIAKRDPGNKPSSGDRIPFVYIQTNGKVRLQGEKIETPEFITRNKIPIDYSFYISNQIMKPVQQVFALVLEEIPEFKKKVMNFKAKIRNLAKTMESEKFEKKEQDLRNKAVKTILFAPYLRTTDNKKQGNREITSFFRAV
jgi:DNA polymerase elongation subunit (family B)